MSGSRRGDVLRAFDWLEIAADEHLVRDGIARLLGMEWAPAAQVATPAPLPPPPPPPIALRPPGHGESPTQAKDPKRTAIVDPPLDPIPEPFTLARVQSAARRFPSWMNDARPLTPAVTVTQAARPSPIPLLDPLQARAVLSGALARRQPDGPIDIEAVLDRIARGDVVAELPRAHVPSIARGVQLLIDRGEGMAPYSVDVGWVRDALQRVVGGYALEVLQFAHSPLRGAGRKSRRTWRPYAELTQPRPGATIVAVTDLGIRNLEPPAQPAAIEEWIAFADHLDRLGCPLLALVPYARARVPAALRRRFAVVEWDRGTTAGRVRSLIARGLP